MYHRSVTPFRFVESKNQFSVVVRLPANMAVDKVDAVYFDPYVKHQQHLKAAKQVGFDGEFRYWSASISPHFKRCRYGFRMTDEKTGECKYLTEQYGLVSQISSPDPLFCLPFVHDSDKHGAPQWARDRIYYQIFPERFARGKTLRPHPNEKEIQAWGSKEPSGATDFFGGNLEGVAERIPYLKELGVNAVYFTPIFEAPSNHKYDTVDYLKIDPGFGDQEQFKQLVKTLHDNGIKVMLDAVFNHCGLGFGPFQDVLKNQDKSKYADWFHIRSFPIDVDPTLPPLPQSHDESPYTYDRYAFERQMPKLKTENPEVRQYLLNVARFWIEKCDIDGWRLDVANEIEHDFWRDFRRAVRSIKSDVFILGEVWHDSLPWLMGDQFDSVMNYPFQSAAVDLALGRITATQFRYTMTRLLMSYPAPINQTLFNLIGSHDTERILTRLGGDSQKMKMLLALEFTSVGTPCIYYGDEVAMEGPFDPGCRRCMPWDEIDTHQSKRQDMFEFYQKLIKMRKNTPALYSAHIEFLEPPENIRDMVLVYRRQLDHASQSDNTNDEKNSATVLVVINVHPEKTIFVDLNDKAFGLSGVRLRSMTDEKQQTMMTSTKTDADNTSRRISRSKSIVIPAEKVFQELSSNTTLNLEPYEFFILSEEPISTFNLPIHSTTSISQSVSDEQQKVEEMFNSVNIHASAIDDQANSTNNRRLSRTRSSLMSSMA